MNPTLTFTFHYLDNVTDIDYTGEIYNVDQVHVFRDGILTAIHSPDEGIVHETQDYWFFDERYIHHTKIQKDVQVKFIFY
jgi:hypothetical protein